MVDSRKTPVYEVDPETSEVIGYVGPKGETISFKRKLKPGVKKVAAGLLAAYLTTVGAAHTSSYYLQKALQNQTSIGSYHSKIIQLKQEAKPDVSKFNTHVLNVLKPVYELNDAQANAIKKVCDENALPVNRVFELMSGIYDSHGLKAQSNLRQILNEHALNTVIDNNRISYQYLEASHALADNLNPSLTSALNRIIEYREEAKTDLGKGAYPYSGTELSDKLNQIPGFNSLEGRIVTASNQISTLYRQTLEEREELDHNTSTAGRIGTITIGRDRQNIQSALSRLKKMPNWMAEFKSKRVPGGREITGVHE